jgi:transposase
MRRLELYDQIKSKDDAILWCREKNLLQREMICPECSASMKEKPHKCEDGRIWNCSRMVQSIRHYRSLSIRHNSFFSNTRLSIRSSLLLIYEWSINTSVDQAAHELMVSKDTIIDFYKRLRRMAAANIEQRTSSQIGGPNEIIEIDECQLGRRKYHRGRIPIEIWVFGALVRNSRPLALIIEIVPNRTRLTLEEIINRRIDPQSRIISDGWGGYVGLTNAGFSHDIVNHSENFVNPQDRTIHTQNIENLWRCLRRFLHTKGTYTRRHLHEYIQEFMFRKASINVFECLLSAIEQSFLE